MFPDVCTTGLVACMLKKPEPAVGVPLISPVALSNTSPVGSGPPINEKLENTPEKLSGSTEIGVPTAAVKVGLKNPSKTKGY